MNGRIYIAGAENAEEYAKTARKLRKKGWEVIDPPHGLAPELQAQAHVITLTYCTAIYLTSKWEYSEEPPALLAVARLLELIVIYEQEPRNREIKTAIESAMGVTFKTIAEDSRNRWHVYARMIYAHHAKKQNQPIKQIAEETRHDESTIAYYLRRYDGEYKFNRDFRAAAEKVATLLSKKYSIPSDIE